MSTLKRGKGYIPSLFFLFFGINYRLEILFFNFFYVFNFQTISDEITC
jgi:hypothetical protein